MLNASNVTYCIGRIVVENPHDIKGFAAVLLQNLKNGVKSSRVTSKSPWKYITLNYIPLVDVFAAEYSTDCVLYSGFERKSDNVILFIKTEGTDGSEFFANMATGLDCYIRWEYTEYPANRQVTANFSPVENGTPWLLGPNSRTLEDNDSSKSPTSSKSSGISKGSTSLRQLALKEQAKRDVEHEEFMETHVSLQALAVATQATAKAPSSLAALASSPGPTESAIEWILREEERLVWYCRMACAVCDVFKSDAHGIARERVVADMYSASSILMTLLSQYRPTLSAEEKELCKRLRTISDVYKMSFGCDASRLQYNAQLRDLPDWDMLVESLSIIKRLGHYTIQNNTHLIPTLEFLEFEWDMW